MYVLVCIYFSLPRKRCELRDGEQSSHYWEAFYLFSFLYLLVALLPLLHSSICLSVCSAIRTKNLSIWKSVIFACVVQPTACVVCTTRTVIYVVLCTLNLDPANDLVDLGKKEAAAESPVSFFS